MARGFWTLVGIFAIFADPFIIEVFASPSGVSIPKLSLASVKEEIQPRRERSTLWSGAAVIFEIHPDIGCPTSFKCKIIMDAIQHYEENTCIRFKDRSGEVNYVEIFDAPNRADCSTVTGRVGYGQTLVLGNGCWYREAIIHELGHTVGLPDEVTRPDRDEYVEINFDNISPNNYYAYRREHPAFPKILTIPFDYYSIMMYGPHASAMNPSIPTIKSKNENETVDDFNDKVGLSTNDKRKISTLYQCQGTDQNPKFPYDVNCSFSKDLCGFKNLDDVEWSRKSAANRKWRSTGKYVGVDYKKNVDAPSRLISVNFHGLSTLDKVRGPDGCASFSYTISSDKTASLKLSVMQLNSPRQLDYAKHSTPLWVKSEEKVDWTTVSIPVQVTKPFTLVFQAEFQKGATEGEIGFDEFKLSYSRCKNPTDAPLSSLSLPKLPQTSRPSLSAGQYPPSSSSSSSLQWRRNRRTRFSRNS